MSELDFILNRAVSHANKFSKFGAVGDRFQMRWQGSGVKLDGLNPTDANALLSMLESETGFNFSNVSLSCPNNGLGISGGAGQGIGVGVNQAGGYAGGSGISGYCSFDISVDDEISGSGDWVTLQNQSTNLIKSVLAHLFNNYTLNLVSASTTGGTGTGTVTGAGNTNTGGGLNIGGIVAGPGAGVKPPATKTNQSWFDKNFFDGAGAITGAGIAVIIVIGAIVVTSKNR